MLLPYKDLPDANVLEQGVRLDSTHGIVMPLISASVEQHLAVLTEYVVHSRV